MAGKTGAGMKGASYHARRVAEKVAKHGEAVSHHLRAVLDGGWNQWAGHRRDFEMYDTCFRQALSGGILNALLKVRRRKNRLLVVIEDGAGEGLFLSSLKKSLNGKGVPSELIALSLLNHPSLVAKRKRGEIDRIVVGPAELYLPKKPADLIVSMYGSIQYAHDLLKKEHVLKFANSLRKGGIMLIGFSSPFLERARERLDRGIGDVSEESMPHWLRREKAIELGFQDLKKIEKAFAKRGFEAKAYASEKHGHYLYPPFLLAVRKL